MRRFSVVWTVRVAALISLDSDARGASASASVSLWDGTAPSPRSNMAVAVVRGGRGRGATADRRRLIARAPTHATTARAREPGFCSGGAGGHSAVGTSGQASDDKVHLDADGVAACRTWAMTRSVARTRRVLQGSMTLIVCYRYGCNVSRVCNTASSAQAAGLDYGVQPVQRRSWGLCTGTAEADLVDLDHMHAAVSGATIRWRRRQAFFCCR